MLAVFTGMVTVIASALLVIIFSALTHFKVNNTLTALDEKTKSLIQAIQRFTLSNGILFALLAVPTTIFYWIAPLFIDFDDTGAAILPQAVSYAALEFVTQIVVQVYLITDAINILVMFKEVRMASKKLMQQIMEYVYKVWQMRHKFWPKTNKVTPISPPTDGMSLNERSGGSETPILSESRDE